LTGLAFAAWMYGRFVRWENSKATQWIFTFLAILAVAGSITFIANKIPSAASENTAEATQEKGFEGWLNFTPELVADLVAKGEPVFIDFGAKWCMTCIANEKTVTTTDEMKAAFASKQVKLVRGDYTKKNPVMLEFMKNFGRAGVPFYVLYIPGKEPKLFPETITIPMLKKALEEIK
jgi:thiol:disulfide interchange protein DsbD